MTRHLYLALGFLSLALGIIGAFLPLLPTTIFIIIAAYFFGRSSERLEARILNHPKLGPPVVAWRREGAISTRAKIAACTGMAAGYAIFHVTGNPAPLWRGLAAAGLIASAIFVVTRPKPSAAQAAEPER
ncbi:YbaN family protein [Sphingosinicella soli]|uniref:DUF454 domain-containing protein n=1 Tax=Sphingosinicella soli TaxID=333708 RepID=A0A7W7B0M4_9SPHN|nr:YbaN family protein [Sphingosinicella soli]MBB4630797.1 hypothetical protein [Sphingosinicella soli]